MAKYWGYVLVPHDSYLQWKTNTLNNGYDTDSYYGCQCYDFSSLFWWNVGFPQGYPHIDQSSAYRMWYYRDMNATYNGVTYFDLIYNLADVKQGDVIVYDQIPGVNPYGHVGFADEDYDTWHAANPGNYEFPILSENNGGFPDPAGGAYVNVHGYDTRLFIGAFRYREWGGGPTPPTPSTSSKQARKRFPWVLYANKLRNKY